MGQRRLNELLREDQEPFVLQSYIAERRRELGSSPSETQLQLRSLRRLRKRRPTSERERFPVGLCKNSCFLQFRRDSPEIGKSPPFGFGFGSPASRTAGGAVFLHIPASTTALILDAAIRIQRQSSPPSKPRFGIFDSIVKRLRSRIRPRNREIEESKKVRLSVRDVLRWDSSAGERGTFRLVDDRKSGLFSRNRSKPSSAVWSETNSGDKSPDLEASTSGSSRFGDSEDVFVRRDAGECDNVGDSETPFGFVLRRSTSSTCRTPEILSPENSPSRSKTEDEEKCEMEVLRNGGEEDEKEQCSPVSILDPPFNDDDNGNDDDDDDTFDIESNYEIVERAKLQLLHKLRRFEKLADLDPIDLEKRMQENNEDEYEEQELQCDDPTASSGWHVPKFLKLLVSDLVSEEEKQESVVDGEEAMRRVVKRLEAWKEVESNTIDMMVEQDFRGELGLWKRCQEQVGEVLAEIEVSIFGVLVEEVWN